MSLQVGSTQAVVAHRKTAHGVYLRAGEEEVLLPNREVPAGLLLGERLEVFVYADSEDRPIATLRRPLAQVGDIVCLQVVDVAPPGAFVDWGLDKHLLVPRSEQHEPLRKGDMTVVIVLYHEGSRRVFASTRVTKYLNPSPSGLSAGQEVVVRALRRTPLGVSVVVDGQYEGLIHGSGEQPRLALGEEVPAYLARIREDGKLDIRLVPVGAERRNSEKESLLQELNRHDGWLPLTDKSPPEEIEQRIGLSKKAFKRALGQLYRERRVRLEESGVRLLSSSSDKS